MAIICHAACPPNCNLLPNIAIAREGIGKKNDNVLEVGSTSVAFDLVVFVLFYLNQPLDGTWFCVHILSSLTTTYNYNQTMHLICAHIQQCWMHLFCVQLNVTV